jgi:DNA-binding GntR family transcriptional regulator
VPDDLDDLSGIPRYLQVARAIEAEIRAGQWTPGNAVPSRNQLTERFGIARETAARAHAWLARAGYLVAVPGVGMVVTPVTAGQRNPLTDKLPYPTTQPLHPVSEVSSSGHVAHKAEDVTEALDPVCMCGRSERRYTARARAPIRVLAGYRSRMRTRLPARPGPGR